MAVIPILLISVSQTNTPSRTKTISTLVISEELLKGPDRTTGEE